MKIKSREKANIITIPNDFTSIDKINFEGDIKEVTYSIEYEFDIIRALRSDVKDVKITLLKKPPKKKASTFGTRRTTGSRLKKELQRSRKNARRRTAPKPDGVSSRIARKRSDISGHIDNRYAGMRKRITRQMLPMKKVIKSVKKSSLNKRQAIIKTYVKRQEKRYKRKPEPKKSAKKMIFQGGLDPARIASRRPPVISAVENFQGISRNLGKSSLNASKRPRRVSKKAYYGYVNSLNKVSVSTNSSDSVSERGTVPMPVMMRQETKKVTEKITFDEELIIGRFFYVKFDVFNTKGLRIQSIIRRVDHARERGISKSPKKRPVLKVSKISNGINYIEIKHDDPNANAVLLQFRVLNPMQPLSESKYTTVGTYDCQAKLGGNSIRHVVGTQMPIQYRAILTDTQGQLSPIFSSEIFSPDPGKDYTVDSAEGMVFAYQTAAGIRVEVIDGPDDLAGWSVWRKIPSVSNQYYNITMFSDETVSHSDFLYVDSKVSDGITYEYKFQFHHMNGSTTYTKNCYQIEARTTDTTSGDVVVDNLRARSARNRSAPGREAFTVQANLSAKFNANDAEDLFSFISNSGAPDLFDSDLDTVKSALSEISHFRVSKLDLKTGEIYELGVFPKGRFIDNPNTTRTPLHPGRSYRYLFELCISHPEEIFTRFPHSLNRSSSKRLRNRKRNLNAFGARNKALGRSRKRYKNLSSATKLGNMSQNNVASPAKQGTGTLGGNQSLENKETSVFNPNYPEKFFSRFIIEDGTLSYGPALIDNHAEGMYEIGATGVFATAEITVPLNLPEIVEGNARVRKRRRRRKKFHGQETNHARDQRANLTWSLSTGPRQLIDHFIILADDQGSEYSIGAVHNIPRRGTYSFTDRSHGDHVGPITYYVVPVYLDYERGQKFEVGTVEY